MRGWKGCITKLVCAPCRTFGTYRKIQQIIHHPIFQRQLRHIWICFACFKHICVSSLQRANLVFYVGSQFSHPGFYFFCLSSAQVVVEYRLLYGNFLHSIRIHDFQAKFPPSYSLFSPGYS